MPHLPTHARNSFKNVRRLATIMALCAALAASGFAGPESVNCRQLKSLGYLEAQTHALESDPALQARLGELVEADIRGKIERQPDLAKCLEPTSSTRGSSSGSSSSLSGSPTGPARRGGSGVFGSYLFAGTFLALWGLFVTR